MRDKRYQALHAGLNQLSNEELRRLIAAPPDAMVFDGCNYDPDTGRY